MSNDKQNLKSRRGPSSQENENEKKELTRTERNRRRQRILYMVVSLVSACALWLYVMEAMNPTVDRTFIGIKVEIMNESELLEKDLAITTKEDQYVKVRVSGKRRTLMDMDESDVLATVDASECTSGENYVDVSIRAPHSVDVEKVTSPQIKLEVESIVTDRKPVNVVYTGEVKEGTQPVTISQQTFEVEVTGVESQVKKVSEVRASVDTGKLTDSPELINAGLTAVSKKGEEVSGITLSQENTEVSAQLYTLKEIGLNTGYTGRVAEGFRLVSFDAPETIRIVIPSSEADGVHSVTADTIDLSSLKKSKTVDLVLDLPENAKLADGKEKVQAQIRIAKITTRSVKISTDDILIENLPEGRSLAFVSPNVDILLKGTAADLSRIGSNDIKVSVDASRVDSSVKELPLIIEINQAAEDGEDLVEIEETAAEVTVS
ncbi:MAG: hypothetical protein IKD86_03615 [Firmicutes bacterium]|nr:hypothetical protein [Bacillota bacterium]